MMSRFLFLVFLFGSLFLEHVVPIQAQFGVAKQEQQQQQNHPQQTQTTPGAEEVQILTPKDVATIEALIIEAAKDPDVLEMVAKVQSEMSHEMDELAKLPQEDILGGMKECIDQIQSIDSYFIEDPHKAVDEMNQSGLVHPDDLKRFTEDPDQLYQDIIQAIYFQFVSLSVVGGFLEMHYGEEGLVGSA